MQNEKMINTTATNPGGVIPFRRMSVHKGVVVEGLGLVGCTMSFVEERCSRGSWAFQVVVGGLGTHPH